MKTAIFAGSFDPITNGHLDILNQAAELFDKIIILVGYNPQKQGFLPVENRMNLIKACTKNYENIDVDSYTGLTVNYAKSANANFLIRGVRSSADFGYELEMAQINRKLNSDIQTIFFAPKAENQIISSSMVRELLSHKTDISNFVPKEVNAFLATYPLQ